MVYCCHRVARGQPFIAHIKHKCVLSCLVFLRSAFRVSQLRGDPHQHAFTLFLKRGQPGHSTSMQYGVSLPNVMQTVSTHAIAGTLPKQDLVPLLVHCQNRTSCHCCYIAKTGPRAIAVTSPKQDLVQGGTQACTYLVLGTGMCFSIE